MICKIAIISYHTCPLSDEKDAEIGGINTYILELSKALTEKGFIIDIYTRCVDNSSPKIVNVKNNLRVIHLLAGEPKNFINGQLLKFLPEFTKNLKFFIKSENLSYDLINAHYFLSGLIGLELRKEFRIPLFVTFHTLALMKNLIARNENEKEALQRIKSEALLTKKADKIIATSSIDKDYIQTLYNCPARKISILVPGVNLNLFKPVNKEKAKKVVKTDLKKRLILFVGRIVPSKGIDVLLFALKILFHKNPACNLCLWIVGGEEKKHPKELKRLSVIRELLNLTTCVKFAGRKSQSELPFYYNASELVILPSQYESFGIIALEAMACGIPVITTDVTGVSGLFDQKHNSLITSACNPLKLAKKMDNLLTNKKEYKKVSRVVLKSVRDLSWESAADKFTRIINKMYNSFNENIKKD